MKFLHLLCLASALASSLNADTIVSDDIGESRAGADGVDLAGPLYDSFASVTAWQKTDLQFILSGDDTSSDTGGVGLYADNSTTPGELMAVLGSVDDSPFSSTSDVYDIKLTQYPLFTDDTLYWIGLSGTTNAELYDEFEINGIGVAEEFFANQTGVRLNYYGPYQMSVTERASVTPEPQSALLMTAGLGVLALLRRRTRTYQLARPDRT